MAEKRGNSGPIDILLVEDNPGDVRLAVEALKEGRLPTRLTSVPDGVEAMAYLRREGPYANATRPHLVLLDLNMPRMDGRQVLAELKTDPKLRSIPVVVLTTSQAERDISQAYDLHANCFISKPVDLDRFITVVRAIEDFWCTVATLPPRPLIA